MGILEWIAFALLMSTLFAIERKLSRANELNEEILKQLKRKNINDDSDHDDSKY
ncbi:hypothetical protein [Bacillus sp. FJAT-45037]|uniref:hypothetical protein n=1 Tax=Bacillus sp. FJAT-45037 TaxID=2011007 RepID=UPI0012FE195B|nr:hypothetical protein [Bacillus sp. FJAT-45037]